ncbi:Hypothetical predicted protein [Xyrichtys novacula]|uniref:Uncharacterized protein n=1 Tax=Xyrichtys novacula TaxID=13765 RepID=A0AAV1H7Y8_XYRNO|nr:Hypothetical predicted protein [Xyrichtys novacula]
MMIAGGQTQIVEADLTSQRERKISSNKNKKELLNLQDWIRKTEERQTGLFIRLWVGGETFQGLWCLTLEDLGSQLLSGAGGGDQRSGPEEVNPSNIQVHQDPS